MDKNEINGFPQGNLGNGNLNCKRGWVGAGVCVAEEGSGRSLGKADLCELRDKANHWDGVAPNLRSNEPEDEKEN